MRRPDRTVRSMSGLRQALRRWFLHAFRHAFRHAFLDQPGRWWHFLLSVVLVLLSVPVFAALALAVRLWIGPIDVTDSARWLVAGSRPGLVLGRVRLAWDGWRHGPAAPVSLLIDAAVLGQTRIGHAFAALDVVALLHGSAAVLAIVTSDSTVVLYRDRTGSITLQAPQPQAIRSQASRSPARPPASRLDLAYLRRVVVTRSAVILHDAASGQSCHASIADLALRAPGGPDAAGVTGRLAASLSCGEAGAGPHVALRGEGREGSHGGSVWRFATDPVVPAAFAPLIPALAPLAALDLPVGLTLVTTVSAGLGRATLPRELNLTAVLGAGTLRMATPKTPEDASVPVAAGSIDLALSLPDMAGGATRLVLSGATLELAGADAPTLHVTGALSRTGSQIRGSLETRIARFGFDGVPRIWPQQLARGARRWVTDNITTGTGRNLAVSAGLQSDSGWDGLHLTQLSGGFDATGLTLHWLRPITPLHGMDAHLVLEGPDALRIESRHATEDVHGTLRQGVLAVGPAVVRITGLTRKNQLAYIDMHLGGALQDVLTLLANPRLRLLSRHPPPFTDPSGAVEAHLVLSIPLVDRVTADDLPIRAEATLTEVHLGDVAAGRDLDRATLSLTASNDGLKLHGQGTFGGLPSSLAYDMDFRPGRPGQTTESGHLTAQIDAAAVQREGLDGAHRFTGEALLDLGYDRKRGAAVQIALALDLTRSGIETPFWRKSAGTAAQVTGVVGLQDNRVVSIDTLHATGPDLLLDAHAVVDAGQPHALVIERFAIGRSRGAGRIELPTPGTQRAVGVALHGPTLDLTPFFRPPASSGHAPPRSGDAKTAAPVGSVTHAKEASWRADLAFRRVLFSTDHAFSDVALHAEAVGERVSSASLSIGGPTTLTAALSPDRTGRRLVLDAQDAGALLATLGVGERIEGGVLSLEGRMEDRPAGMRLTALAKIGPFTVQDAPLAARLARDLSIYGFLMGAPSRQLVVTHFEVPFTLEGDTLRLTGARASNAALGATLRGPIDLRQDTFDLRGTIVPSYLFNALPGKLPGIGKVFSPEQGGGLLAVTLSITGPVDQPAIKVNPLALLAPGILRRLLFD